MALAHLSADRPFLTDGGLETVLIHVDGIDLPEFAAFPLLERPDGRAALERYYDAYLSIAQRHGRGMLLDTPTWRANADWGAVLGYDADRLRDVNTGAVEFVRTLGRARSDVPVVVEGVVGPRGDGYVVDAAMSPDEAAAYHRPQVEAFSDAGADLVTILTTTNSDEAVGVVRAATAVGLPAAVSFTLETDGRLPSGETLAEAIDRTDEATAVPAAYFMVNCAHPSHFDRVLASAVGEAWLDRLRGVRANASAKSHAELDESDTLDRGDVHELSSSYRSLAELLDLVAVGGCCGTDEEHLDAIAAVTD